MITPAARAVAHAASALALAGLAYATAITILFLHGRVPRHRAETAWFIAGSLTAALCAALSRSTTHSHSASRQPRWLTKLRTSAAAVALFVAASLVLYSAILPAGLLSDDFVLIERARAGQLTMGTDFFRPLPLALWNLVARAGLDDSIVLHAVNVVLHGVNAGLVFLIGSHLGLERRWSLAAGALFLASPASVEPVTWVSGLFDVLMTAATLGYLFALLTGRWALALTCLVAALLSKETGIVAAFLGIVLALIARRPLALPFTGAAITAVFTAVRVVVLPLPDTYLVTPSRYVLKELFSRAFGAIALPWTSSDIANQPLVTLFPWLVLAWLLGLAVISRLPRAHRWSVFFFAAWVVVSVLPAYSFIYVTPDLEGSRYVYLGTAGFSLLVAVLMTAVAARRLQMVTAALVAAAVVCGSVGVRIHQRSWLSAARERDAVLHAARHTLSPAACASVSITALPDAREGAYVFRNGFREALTASGIQIPMTAGTDAECTFQWVDGTFSRIDR